MNDKRFVVLADLNSDEVYTAEEAREEARRLAVDQVEPVYVCEVVEEFQQQEAPVMSRAFAGVTEDGD